jgi:hypothetical protein
MKWSKLHKQKNFDLSDSEDEDSDDEDDDEEDEDARMEHRAISHPWGGINRIRGMPQAKILATWGEDGVVRMWNVAKEFDSMATGKVRRMYFMWNVAKEFDSMATGKVRTINLRISLGKT